ncbi:MAG: TolC family protein [Bdellovibrionia bacterium]
MKNQISLLWPSVWILGFLLTSLSVFADDRLTLGQAIQEGLELSPTVQKFQSVRDQSKWNTYVGLSGLLPKIELHAKHDFSNRYETVPVTLGSLSAAVPKVYPKTAFGIEAQWVLFNGFANVHQYQASLNTYEASEQQLSRTQFEAKKRIQLAFYNALAAQRFEEVAEENVRTLQENMRQVNLRMQNGRSTQYDVLRVEVQLSDAKTELERTQDNVIILRRLLAQAMGKKSDPRFLNGELPVPKQAGIVQNLSTPDVHERQDYRAGALRSEAADHEAKAASGALLPVIGLSTAYDRYENTDYPGQAYGGFRDAWNIGVFAKWNILDGGATIARSGAAQASARRAEYEYQEAVLNVPADYELWKRRYLYSAHRYDAKSEDLKRSQESLRIAELSFQQGRRTITDVLEAETDLFRARAGVVQSQLDAEEALVKLELTFGKDLI